MKAYQASLLNALILILLGVWAYLVSDNPSFTAFIPVAFGLALIVINPGLKKERKLASHIAVVLTILVSLGLIKPLVAAIGRDDTMAIVRVVVMMLSSLLAIYYFVRSFIDVRRARDNFPKR